MNVLTLLSRNIKWRFHNAFTVVVTILQPLLWLVLYSAAAGQTMRRTGIPHYTAFVLPGLFVLVTFSACSSGGIMNYMMRADGSFDRILTAPVNRSSVVLGQLLEAVLCAFFEAGILTAAAAALFSVRIALNLTGTLLLFGLLFLMAFFIAGLACAVSLTLPDIAAYETVMNAVALPIFFLSPALFPAESMDGILRTAVECNPFTPMIRVLRSLILYGSAEADAVLSVLFLFAILASLGFLWALHKVRTLSLSD